jgi:hypothetical protein
VLFGGSNNGTAAQDTWEFDGLNWTQVMISGAKPPPRTRAAMSYSYQRGAIVLFGGQSSDQQTALNDTWLFDGTKWTELVLDPKPFARQGHVLMQSADSTLLMAGGRTNQTSSFDDAWRLDAMGWSKIADATAQKVTNAGITMHRLLNRPVSFGGNIGATLANQTFELDGTWKELQSSSPPPAISFAPMAYVDGRTVLMLQRETAVSLPTSISWELKLQSNPEGTPERCIEGIQGDPDANLDSDKDGLIGCADPDCWNICTPLCPPTTTFGAKHWPASCEDVYPGAPHCGDGVCNAFIENYIVCPTDCAAP